MQSLDPEREKLPDGHDRQLEACWLEYAPDLQVWQVRLSSYLPAGQARHTFEEDAASTAPLYVPDGQALQSWRSPLNWTSRYVWYGQEIQAEVLAGAYWPNEQVWQLLAPELDTVPFWHTPQTVWPGELAYWPDPQGVHTRESSYVPAEQEEQAKTVCAPR